MNWNSNYNFLPQTPVHKRHHSLTEVNGKLYLFGGYDGEKYYKTLWEYDISTKLWAKKTSMPSDGRAGHMAVAYNDNIYIFGGNTGDYGDPKYVSDEFWEYNTSTDTWTQLNNTVVPARTHGSIALNNDKIYILAGHSENIGVSGISSDLHDLWVYDFSTQSFSELSSMDYRLSAQCTTIKNNKLYSFGGDTDYSNEPIFVYDISVNEWEYRNNLIGYIHKTKSFLYNDDIYIYAGNVVNGNTDILRKYNDNNNSYQTISIGLQAVNGHDISVYNENLYSYGGNLFNGNSKKLIEYSFSNNKWEFKNGFGN